MKYRNKIDHLLLISERKYITPLDAHSSKRFLGVMEIVISRNRGDLVTILFHQSDMHIEHQKEIVDTSNSFIINVGPATANKIY